MAGGGAKFSSARLLTLLFLWFVSPVNAQETQSVDPVTGLCSVARGSDEECNFSTPGQGFCSPDCKYTQPSGMVYLENEILRTGFRLDWGGGLTYISFKGGPNMVNDFPDPGREIQVDLRLHDSNPTEQGAWWRCSKQYTQGEVFNPDKDYRIGSPLIAYEIDHGKNKIWTKTRPLDFNPKDGACPITDYFIEKEVTLKDNVIRFDYTISYFGDKEVREAGPHELPALFAHRRYNKWVYYSGEKPWTNDAVETMTYEELSRLVLAEGGGAQAMKGLGSLPERWVSVVDGSDFGLTLVGLDMDEVNFIIKAEDHLNEDPEFRSTAVLRNVYAPIQRDGVIETTFYVVVDTWQNARQTVYQMRGEKPEGEGATKIEETPVEEETEGLSTTYIAAGLILISIILIAYKAAGRRR